jgi:hypothetical protein
VVPADGGILQAALLGFLLWLLITLATGLLVSAL